MLVKRNNAKWLPAILTDDSDFKTPVTGVGYASAAVYYAKEGDSGLSTKSLGSGDWSELGQGMYRVLFSAAELDTLGEFYYIVVVSGCLNYYGWVQVTDNVLDDLAQDHHSLSSEHSDITDRLDKHDSKMTAFRFI